MRRAEPPHDAIFRHAVAEWTPTHARRALHEFEVDCSACSVQRAKGPEGQITLWKKKHIAAVAMCFSFGCGSGI